MPTAVETIIFTAVPNGLTSDQTHLQVSIHVSPTLSGGVKGTLEDFSDFADWPGTFSSQAGWFRLAFTNASGPTTVTQNVQIDTSVLRSDLWKALFNPVANIDYRARDAAEPYTKVPVVSYPAGKVASFLQDTYASLAIGSPKAYPDLSTLANFYGSMGFVGRDGVDRLNSLFAQLSSERLQPTFSPTPRYANDFSSADIAKSLAALRFYHLPPQGPRPVATLPMVDFHRALTFIGEHRTLQRALGLVFDLQVPVANLVNVLSASSNSNFFVSALAVGPTVDHVPWRTTSGVTYTPVTPRTQCDASTSVFQAHAVTSQIVGRQLTLGDSSSFLVHEIDVDGGGLKTAMFADNLALARQPQSADPSTHNGAAPDAPTSYAPPSLRSAGLTVTAVNRGLAFEARLNRSADLMAGIPSSVPDLTAEDLVRGFVLDVHDSEGNAWHSTAMRDVTYTAGSVTLNVTDEASTDAPAATQTDPTKPSQPQLNLPENIIRWNGWSNAAPRPGMPIQDDGSVAQGGTDPGPFHQLSITVTPTPATLPRLRFGQLYALRARVMDITGNVIPLSAGADVGDSSNRVSPESIYGRHEPIGSPDIYNPSTTPLPGESLKRLVIRDLDAAAGSKRSFAPNRIAEAFAELHGMFDLGSGASVTLDQSAYSTILALDGGHYPATPPSPSPGPASFFDPVPYLPDPLSRGGVLTPLNGALGGTLVPFDFAPASGKNWPAYRPFGLSLMPGGAQTASIDSAKRLVTVNLTKADTVLVQLSSTFAAGDLPALGLYSWIRHKLGGPVSAAYQADTVAGQHWAFTPYTTLELIYAVQKPLLLPKYSSLSALRQLGWTYAQLFGDLTYSPKSTAKTDVLAAWEEVVDNGPGSGAPMGPGAPKPAHLVEASLFTIPSALTQQATRLDRFTGRHEFFDTKHRKVAYGAKSTSRFTEHYQGQRQLTVPSPGTPTSLELPGFPGLGLEPGSVRVTSQNGKTVYTEDKDFKIKVLAGTITFLASATGPAVGSKVEVSFLPPVSVLSSKPVTLNILSTARPASVTVPFIVPIYRWLPVKKNGSKLLSVRSPSALRVFLDRPWWTSGVGELLGVVTLPGAERRGVAGTPDDAALYVSDWGADPVFASPALPSAHPRLSSFPGRVHDGKNLTIEEHPGLKVNVAGHAVGFDAARDLWYCDIRVNTGRAYTPMIRLALARYQPNSIGGVELGRIVLADVMSLEPGRAAVVVRKSPTLLESVTLAGYSYKKAGNDSGTGPGFAQVVVERRLTHVKDAVVGWEAIGPPIPMQSATGKNGLTFWTARQIDIPAGGKHRLVIEQYELLPTDDRSGSFYITYVPSRGFRLLFSDVIPL